MAYRNIEMSSPLERIFHPFRFIPESALETLAVLFIDFLICNRRVFNQADDVHPMSKEEYQSQLPKKCS